MPAASSGPNNSTMCDISHVIFDMDGLLLDTESLYTEATQLVCDPFNKQYTFDIKQQVMGMRGEDAQKTIVSLLDLPMDPQEFGRQTAGALERLFPNCRTMPGANELVEHLFKHKIPLAVCTGSNKVNFALKTGKHKNLFSKFQFIVLCSDDEEVKRSKPDPQPYQVTLSRFEGGKDLDPAKVLVFEDAPNGVESAKAAGMNCIMVPDPRVSDDLRKRADVVLNSLTDFKPELWGLPPF